jgi:hypothetical protein
MNDDIAWEVSNVYRSNISRRRIFKKNKRTKQSLEQQANSICKDALSERYIHNAFGKFDDGYIYYDRQEEEILGFCLWKVYKESQPILHILLVCSSDPSYSLGKTMVNDIEYYCFENKIEYMSVSPATTSLFEYYKRFGFSIDDKDKTKMLKKLNLPQIHRRKKNKTRKLSLSKKNSPMAASMMPINMNTWKNNLV